MAESPSRLRNRVLLGLAIVLIVLVAWASWVAVRGLMARDALQSAASQIRAAQSDASVELLGSLGELSSEVGAKTADAASLTSDPLWRVAEVLPWAGPNLVAFRETAASVDDIVREALPPLATVSKTIDANALTLRGGGLPVAELRNAQPQISEAQQVVAGATETVLDIDTDNVLPQIGEAVSQVRALAVQADELLTGLDTAARILPPMLGIDEAREYLFLFQNNAELRAGGGIPGATSVISAFEGRIDLVDQSDTGDFRGSSGEPVLELSLEERALYTDILGTYIQNATMTPDFARSGELAQARWQQLTGQMVDGVIAVDPVALSYLLEATGPIVLADGTELNADNAVSTLLSDVYSRFEEPAAQDAFFALAAATVFDEFSNYEGSPTALLEALARGADERRLLLWSDRDDEQELLGTTGLTGTLPASNDDTAGFGIYLNDATGAKMDYYLDGTFGASAQTCRNDGRPEYRLGATLTSSAPQDAASSLPRYVTGGEAFGVPEGEIRTDVSFFAPPGSIIRGLTVDGQEVGFTSTMLNGYSVAQVRVQLTPGQVSSVVVEVLGGEGASDVINLEHTPMVRAAEVRIAEEAECVAGEATTR